MIMDEPKKLTWQQKLAIDDLLRSLGFQLVRRPDKGEPLWKRRGRTLRQGAALAIAERERVKPI